MLLLKQTAIYKNNIVPLIHHLWKTCIICFQAVESNFFKTESTGHDMLSFHVEILGRIQTHTHTQASLWTVGKKQFRRSGLRGETGFEQTKPSTRASQHVLCGRLKRELWASSWLPVYLSGTTGSAPQGASASG